MSEVIVITSGKGGVGKTVVTANLGAGLAQLGNKVVLVDTDIGLRNLDIIMGLENQIMYNLVDVIEEKCELSQALVKAKTDTELYLLSSAQTKDKSCVSPAQMKTLCEQLQQEFDYVLLDCATGIDQGFYNAIAGANRALVVATPEIASIRDADRVIGLLRTNKIMNIQLIVNRLYMDMVKKGYQMSVEDIKDVLPVDIIGLIPEDEAVMIAASQGELLIEKDTMMGQSQRNICIRISGDDVPLLDFSGKKSFLKRIFGNQA